MDGPIEPIHRVVWVGESRDCVVNLRTRVSHVRHEQHAHLSVTRQSVQAWEHDGVRPVVLDPERRIRKAGRRWEVSAARAAP